MQWHVTMKSGINHTRLDYRMTQETLPDSLCYNTCSPRMGRPRPGWLQKTGFLDVSKPNFSKWHQEESVTWLFNNSDSWAL